MRDSFADEEHFLRFIEGIERVARRGRQALAEGTKKERRPGSASRRYWKGRIDVLECRYSLGVAVDELRQEFSSLVDELKDLEAFDASTGGSIDLSVTLCSWAVLLDDAEAAETLAFVLERDGVFHTRTALLLAYFDIHPTTQDPRNPMEDYFVGRARSAIANGDSAAASKILYKFVNEEWFQITYNSGLRPLTHTGEKYSHVGYWCYEAAAFAKILGIDDSRLERHKYYPWDLAHP